MTKKEKIKIKHWDYCGKVKNEKPHGKGELTLYSNKKFSKRISSFKGNFDEENFEGNGEYTQYDKNNKWRSKLTGKFKNHNITKGKLILKFSEGNMEYNGELRCTWFGNILSPMPHGKGVKKNLSSKFKSYSIANGFWIEASQNGKGSRTYFKDKNFTNKLKEYKGSFKNNEYHGFGTLIDYLKNNKFKYIGNWKNGKMHGYGKSIDYEQGRTYEGDFKNNTMAGLGMMIDSNGDSFEGKFKDGYKHGLGIYIYKSPKYKSKISVIAKYEKGELIKIIERLN